MISVNPIRMTVCTRPRLEGRQTGYDEGGSQEEVVGDTSAVGTED